MIPKLDNEKIVQVRLKEAQYYQEEHPKKQIVLHHTVSNGNAKNVITWWAKTPARIGVVFIIDREGVIHKCFRSKHWAHHLDTKVKSNKELNQQSTGIELYAWGSLKRGPLTAGKIKATFHSNTGSEIPENEVVKLSKPFRGSEYFQCYTEKQLNSFLILVNYLCKTNDIHRIYYKAM